jgi:AraC-like DNA-binding protein
VNLTSYLHRVRLEHAMLLLASGERSISEIAYLVGYQNYRDFYRNFVKRKSASPRQVQRELGREAPPPLNPSG